MTTPIYGTGKPSGKKPQVVYATHNQPETIRGKELDKFEKEDKADKKLTITPNQGLAVQIQQARMAKKLTQSDVDKLCNFPVNTTKCYENKTIVVAREQLTLLSNALGVQFKMPRPKRTPH